LTLEISKSHGIQSKVSTKIALKSKQEREATAICSAKSHSHAFAAFLFLPHQPKHAKSIHAEKLNFEKDSRGE